MVVILLDSTLKKFADPLGYHLVDPQLLGQCYDKIHDHDSDVNLLIISLLCYKGHPNWLDNIRRCQANKLCEAFSVLL